MKDIQMEILHNPYDFSRDQFIKFCKQNIKYLKNAKPDYLKRLYYESE